MSDYGIPAAPNEIKYGHFSLQQDSDLPWPEIDQPIDQEFLDRLKAVETALSHRTPPPSFVPKGSRMVVYRGGSCVLCKSDGSSAEFMIPQTATFRITWSANFRHYMEDHGVAPPSEFVRLIDDLFINNGLMTARDKGRKVLAQALATQGGGPKTDILPNPKATEHPRP